MKTEVLDNADLVALKAASIIAGEARKAVLLRGCFILAVSGGKTPWKMLRALADEDVPGKECIYCRLMNAWHRMDIPTET